MEILCQKCHSSFEKKDILVCRDGLFCKDCVPDDAMTRIFIVHFSWTGIMALVDTLDGKASVEQMLIADKIRDKLAEKMAMAIKELMDEIKIPESDSESLGTGDDEYRHLPEDGESGSTD